jgi:hypothetical protein
MLVIPPPGSNRRNYKNAKSAVLGGRLQFAKPPQPAPAAAQVEVAPQADAVQTAPAQADTQEQSAAAPPDGRDQKEQKTEQREKIPDPFVRAKKGDGKTGNV